MKVYQVGGSVRDMILGKTPHDVDYVVIGATIDDMLSHGFVQVGRDFPVFLHPKTKEEYALARKEIKTGDKHTDFKFIFDESVTLEEDLQRRDFTCNALVYDEETQEIIDLVGGKNDITNKILRHVNSEHFGEDPLRVLRMCRFAAALDFTVAPETMNLAKYMVKNKQINHLTAERVWKEFEKALKNPNFAKFIELLRECGALKVIMPEIDRLWDTPERLEYHPEGNSGAHTLLVLKQAENEYARVKFACLLHDVGKGLTPPDILPSHYNHDYGGVDLIKKICRRLKVRNDWRDFAIKACKYHMRLPKAVQLRMATLLDIIVDVTDNFRNKQNLDDLISVCHCDFYGRAREIDAEEITEFEQSVERCRKFFNKLKDVRASDMPKFNEIPKDKDFNDKYRQFRLDILRQE